MLRPPSRIAGAGLLVASAGSTLAHRAAYHAAQQGPANPLEFGLGLLTFVLASAGILLLIHGDALFARATQRDSGTRNARKGTRKHSEYTRTIRVNPESNSNCYDRRP